MKSFWLLKSEPDVWSIDQQINAGSKGAIWDGVRNYQARNNLSKMRKGDNCFFYENFLNCILKRCGKIKSILIIF